MPKNGQGIRITIPQKSELAQHYKVPCSGHGGIVADAATADEPDLEVVAPRRPEHELGREEGQDEGGERQQHHHGQQQGQRYLGQERI